jgi:hypothetical protein
MATALSGRRRAYYDALDRKRGGVLRRMWEWLKNLAWWKR